ncbi:MAG: response regulator transcription factor [Balneolaceae bacterium]
MDELETTEGLIRVIIVDDNPYIREGWATILDEDPEICVIKTFADCGKVLAYDEILWCDIILLDIQMPGISGIEGVEKLLDINPKLSIVMATILEDSNHVFSALQNGAIGYLTKKVTPDELVRAVKDAYVGGSPMSPHIARKVIDSMQIGIKKSQELQLTEREQEILQHLGEGNSYAAIAKEIYLSVDGVGYHIRNIYRKLQVNSKVEAVAKGIATGLIKIN